MTANRDTQFMGFAKALVTEIINEVPETIYPLEIDISDRLEKLIARRARDLVVHTIVELSCRDVLDFSNPDFDKYEYDASGMVEIIPDMIELPKEERDGI
jgi:hypothetical protein